MARQDRGPALSAGRYLLLALAVIVVAALALPSRISVGLALTIIGSVVVVVLALLVLSLAGGRRAGSTKAAPPAPTKTPEPEPPPPPRPDAEPDPAAAAEARREPPRTRLRALVLLPRPLDASGRDLARVTWQRLVTAVEAAKPDIDVAAVWPPTMEALQAALRSEPGYHLVIVDATTRGHNVLIEDAGGRADPVPLRHLAAVVSAARVRLLVTRISGADEVEPELLKGGMDTVVTVPPGLRADDADTTIARLLSVLAEGDVAGRGLIAANLVLDGMEADTRHRLGLHGANWYSLVDHVTDRQGPRFTNPPRAPSLRHQLWFRNQAAALPALLQALQDGNVVTSLVGAPGSGTTSLAIEAAHRLAPRYGDVVHVDCSALAPALTTEAVLAALAAALRCRVGREVLLVDALFGPAQKRRALVLIDEAHLLPAGERQRLLALADSAPEGWRLLLVSSEALPEVSPAVDAGAIEPEGAALWLRWLARHESLRVLTDISDESVGALVEGLNGNPLAVRVAVGLSERLGLLQSIRTARSVGSLDKLIEMAVERLGQREAEALTALTVLPGALPADVVGAITGRGVASHVVEVGRAGLLAEERDPLLYRLHPHVRRLVTAASPPGPKLQVRAAEAVAEKARSLAKRLRAADDGGERLPLLAEAEPLLENLRLVLAWAGAESGPVAGRPDLVRDVALVLAPTLRHIGLGFQATAVALAGQEAARLVEDHGSRGLLLLEAAEAYREAGELDAAATAYEDAASSFERSREYRRVADVLIRLGTMHWDSGDVVAAKAPLERALTWLERLQDVGGQMSALMVLGHIALPDDAAAAVGYYERARSLAATLPEARLQLAQVSFALGRSLAQAGNHKAAAEQHAHAIELFAAEGDSEGRLQAYRGLGQAYLGMDDRERAVQVLERAAELEERTALGTDAAMDLGRAYMRERRWPEALEHQKRSLGRAEAAGDRRGMAQAYNGLGNVHLELGAKQQAVEAYEEAAKLWRAIGDEVGLARTHNNLAVAYRRAGRWDKARQYLDEAARMLEKGGDKNALASIYNNIGLIMAAQKNAREAARFYERSLALKQELGDLYGANITKANLRALSRRD